MFHNEMPYGCYGVMPQHARTGITHDMAHPLAHIRPVAMHGAFPACRFPVAEPATIKSAVGISQQGGAVFTKPVFRMPVAAAIQFHHL